LRHPVTVLRSISALVAWGALSGLAFADEGGVSFWLPGQYGSFAAIAPDPGFSLPTMSYYYTGQMSASKTLRRGNEIAAGIDAEFFAQFIIPTYTPKKSFLGATPSVSLAILPAYTKTSAEVSVGGLSASREETLLGIGDLYPTVQLFWNTGNSNWMTYISADIPVGSYNADRLANIGTGHAAVDFGGAYTYLNPNTGWEFSATAGLTLNFKNDDTGYTSGSDFHLDLGTAQFLNEQLFVGAVGYVYRQISDDMGGLDILDGFNSQVIGVGPQIGYNFMAGDVAIYTNLRGYIEVESENRPKGKSLFLTVNLPLSKLAAAH
jgi:hypothetical protein